MPQLSKSAILFTLSAPRAATSGFISSIAASKSVSPSSARGAGGGAKYPSTGWLAAFGFLPRLTVMLARVGHADEGDAARAFAAGLRSLGWPEVDPGLPDGDPDLGSLDRALDDLAAAPPALKKQILAGCASCVGADGRITPEEGVLLHAIADSLGCPLPPLRSLDGAGLGSEGGAA